METNFETVAFAMLGRDLSVLMLNLRKVGLKTERDSCAGTAQAYLPDGTCVFRAIQTRRNGTWIVRAQRGLIVVQEVEIVSSLELR
jgi:hypothetical protein